MGVSICWYADMLIAHGDRLLSLAVTSFDNTGVTIHAKIPLMHSWYRTTSHPSELYNTANRDGYESVAMMLAKNSCKMICPGMDLSDAYQPQATLSSPQLLLAQIMAACRKHGVKVSGQNSSNSGAPANFEQIKRNLSGDNVLDLFTYNRMGAYFFSPQHFPSFTKFVQGLNQPKLHTDDLPAQEEEATESLFRVSKSSMQLQAA